MKMDDWKARVVSALDDLADESLQMRAWFGVGPEVSSPSEMIDDLLLSCSYETFLSKLGNAGKAEETLLNNLVNRLKIIDTGEEDQLSLREFISSSDWLEIRNSARRSAQIIRGSETS